MKKDISFSYYLNKIFQSETFNSFIPDKFLNEIKNKTIKIKFKNIKLEIILRIEQNNIFVLEECKNFDVELIASPIDFIMFVLTRGSDKFSSKIKINGDIDTANKFNKFICNSDKFREILVNAIGDNNTEKLKILADSIHTTFDDIFLSPESDLYNFIVNDLNLLPSKNDINNYLNEVDNLRSRTESLLKKYNHD